MCRRDHKYTVKVAEEALQRIKALGLPADPEGYALWYAYVTGANAHLNRRVNDIIKKRGGLLAEEADQIRDEFLSQSNASSAVQHASTKISGEIDQIVGLLSELILSTAQGRNDCASASSKLDNCTDAAAVRAISDALIEVLQAVEQQHTLLEKQFIAAKSELEAANHALARVTAQANSDFVTGLVNRRGFDIALERAAGLARSGERTFSLLIGSLSRPKDDLNAK